MNLNEDLKDSTEERRQDTELIEIIFTYLRHWKWFLLSIMIALTFGYIYLKLVTPKYKIETDLLIKPDKSSSGSQNDLLQDLNLFTSDKIIDNEVQILQSKDILEKVIRSLNLQTSYYLVKGVRKRELYSFAPFEVKMILPDPHAEYDQKFAIRLIDSVTAEVNGKKVLLNKPYLVNVGQIIITRRAKWSGAFNELYNVKFNDVDDLIENYSNRLKVEPVSKQATVLTISIEDALPERGKDVLNRLLEEYNHAALEDKNKVSANTLAFITDRLSNIKGSLGSVEKNVQNYKSQNRIANIGSQSQILLQSVGDNDAQLNKVVIQLDVLQNLEKYLNTNNNDPSSLPSMLGIEDVTLLGLVSNLGEAQQKRQSLLQTVTETNPLVGSYDDQISALKSTIIKSVQNLKRGLEITKQKLEEKNNKFENAIRAIPSQERGLLDVMRQQHLQDTLYMYLLQKREETEMKLASGVADSRTIDHARSSKRPVKPVKSLVYVTFFLLGIFMPASVIYGRGALNFRISRKTDIRRVTNVPIIAEISHSDSQSALLVVEKPRSIVAEQIRALRTNLQFIIPSEDQKTILFTSSISGEGKSFISLNLGSSLAMSGKRVVILELDLRKPKLHMGLDIENINGLSTYLIGKINYKDILIEIPLQKNYYIIPCGPIPPNPAELLGNGHIGKLIDQLKKEFDYIILDAPPVGLVTDAQILGAYADATMFIVRHNYTAKNHIYAIEDLNKHKKFKNLNIVLNSIKFKDSYGYGYGYGYGYSYGGGYYEEESTSKSFKLSQWFRSKKKE
ncbi:MAG TPA: polysaccharide biosynthesis tyrosine autokinase [Mucilaginibacter sp.]|nr:polysaccharide biosynthesis tyrosine autokinase [Mucilaginibacter sp.]